MKKVLAMILCLCVALGVFAGCGKKHSFGVDYEDFESDLQTEALSLGVRLTFEKEESDIEGEIESIYSASSSNEKPSAEISDESVSIYITRNEKKGDVKSVVIVAFGAPRGAKTRRLTPQLYRAIIPLLDKESDDAAIEDIVGKLHVDDFTEYGENTTSANGVKYGFDVQKCDCQANIVTHQYHVVATFYPE
ncbi:hypothetical protein H8K20_03145 [Neobittarella massiliensis]|uniref:Lipoprotein n=1 Tax=Neobittarella massiliensis (ex Bilen et al. 2018) TaxID=2041842 RepID=A0A8J6IMT5_9FIRM|nr:hypothetical protein [Neobittarella massiliensis]MBC3515392.1 hypothetical protein [Neobittarella massiliensis]